MMGSGPGTQDLKACYLKILEECLVPKIDALGCNIFQRLRAGSPERGLPLVFGVSQHIISNRPNLLSEQEGS